MAMDVKTSSNAEDIDPAETAEWLESLQYVLEQKGHARVSYLLSVLEEQAQQDHVSSDRDDDDVTVFKFARTEPQTV